MHRIINGIQQIGIGVCNANTVFNWYRKHLGFDILLFKDEAVASLMTQYTNNKAERREAYLSLNMIGGGGLEIWQFKDRKPIASKVPLQLGDLGIYAMKIRCSGIEKLHNHLIEQELRLLSSIYTPSYNQPFFYFEDPFGNQVQVVSDDYCFSTSNAKNGGVMGAVIGVSNMDRSIDFYSTLFGYSTVVYDGLEDWNDVEGSYEKNKVRKVILQQERKEYGGFAELLGPTQLELVQSLDRVSQKIYSDRLWGDLGYIHLCFDVQGMAKLREKAKRMNHAFTVDSANSFDMGDAAGHFSYVEDPDGTLIELVETHKVPILKSLGIYLNLKKRDPMKTLPKWLVRLLAFHRVKKDLI